MNESRPDQETTSTVDATSGAHSEASVNPEPAGHQKAAWLKPLVLVVCGLIVGLMIGTALASRSQEVDQLNQEAASLKTELQEAKSVATEASSERDAMKSQLEELTAQVPMPNYVGELVDAVEAQTIEKGWTLRVSDKASPKPVGTVLDQEPKPGVTMKKGAQVSVTVAKPEPPAWKTVWSKSGSGRYTTQVIKLPTVDSGNLRVKYSMKGSGNNVMWLCNMMGEPEDLLVNEIGSTAGDTNLYITWEGMVLKIEGSGSWKVDVEAFR